MAWCTGVQGPNGIFVQPVNPATAAPAGAARIVPGSTSRAPDGTREAFCPASTRVPLVARQAKGFFVATVDGSRRTVIGWSVGAARSQRLAGGTAYKQDVAAAASPGSKASVWIGWVDESGNIVLRRSNATATVFGALVTVRGPRDGTSVGLDLNAQTDRVDVVVRVQHGDGSVGLEHAQTFPVSHSRPAAIGACPSGFSTLGPSRERHGHGGRPQRDYRRGRSRHDHGHPSGALPCARQCAEVPERERAGRRPPTLTRPREA